MRTLIGLGEPHEGHVLVPRKEGGRYVEITTKSPTLSTQVIDSRPNDRMGISIAVRWCHKNPAFPAML